MGVAPAGVLHRASFADVLDEQAKTGYQRRFNAQHSLDFRRYIQRPGSATIPLTFNARPELSSFWELRDKSGDIVEILIQQGSRPLSQVDCQHRLGYLADSDISLPFMCFLGLSEKEETEIFGVINGKARGLSTSLLDFHDAKLCNDLASERPELLIALHLNNEPTSPWFNRLDMGGKSVSGLERRASLRTMQKAAKLFLRRIRPGRFENAEDAAGAVHNFWAAVMLVLPQVFVQHRNYMVTKGVGVYALMEIAADMVNELSFGSKPSLDAFAASLSDFALNFNWSNSGPLKGLGGEGGASAAAQIIRESRLRARLQVANG